MASRARVERAGDGLRLRKGATEPSQVQALARAARDRARIEVRIALLVQDLRVQGVSWTVIADQLGVNRQSAHARYGNR